MALLHEDLSFDQAKLEVFEGRDLNKSGGKDLYMKGIFLQADVRNQNQRVYPMNEIVTAVGTLKEKINSGYSVLGEVDHPEELTINLDRVSHVITEMWTEGNYGMGKLKLLPTPMGNIIKSMLEADVKLGVSSRGKGNVGHQGEVSDFEIVTVDIVAQPSAQKAYPNTIYESIMRSERKGNILLEIAEAANHDAMAREYLKKNVLDLIKNLN